MFLIPKYLDKGFVVVVVVFSTTDIVFMLLCYLK